MGGAGYRVSEKKRLGVGGFASATFFILSLWERIEVRALVRRPNSGDIVLISVCLSARITVRTHGEIDRVIAGITG